MDTPATSLSTSGTPPLPTAPARTPAPTSVAPRDPSGPEERWKSLIDLKEAEDIRPAVVAAATAPVRKRPRRRWPSLAAVAGFAAILLAAVITYRITTDKGELVIKTEDPDIEVVVKQGGKTVTIIDKQSKKQIELNSGSYELELQGEKPGLRLSTDKFTLKRGDKTVVTVSREPATKSPPNEKPPAEPAADKGEVSTVLRDSETKSPSNAKPPGGPPADTPRASLIGRFESPPWDLERLRRQIPPRASLIGRFESPHDAVTYASFFPDGRRVAYVTGFDLQNGNLVAGNDPALWIGDLADPQKPRKLTGHTQDVTSVALSKDGHVALTTSEDKTLRLWDIETGKSRVIRREEVGLGSVNFSPDEQRAAYVGAETIYLCELKTGRELKKFRGHTGGRIFRVAFSPDGHRLISCGVDQMIRVWNVETGKEVRQMSHGDAVTDLAFFPDGRRALTASKDSTVGVWDLETGRQLRRIVGFANGSGASVAVSPDGRRALLGRGR